ncbi:putative Glutelin [Thiomonas sp. X19]|uniref:hypothetical protein n=1 Tax=Thiomonas sp. X19 TaxID=1050370 RepID=UPI000B7337F1|nr:hypothetical protein [Thiomonas sp. X19]SCC92614.1 putative Glutelin [Thiomonas sp. X19]
MLRTSLLALTLSATAALAPAAHADGVYWSLGVGGPGVAANFGNVYPAPPVYYAPPPAVTYYPGYISYGVYNRPWHPDRGWHRGWGREDDDDERH